MTKIDIFSGFLGAGKTTLIKKLITEAFAGQQVVLIENEFGEIGIDGGFLKESGIQINELNAGCICCSLVGDFRTALQQVVEQYHPDRIVIEPSGVGKLSDVTRAVEGVAEHLDVQLSSFVTVADVNKVKMYMKNFGEFYDDQISHASCILLSRTQTASEEKIAAAVAMLREKNPTATIVTTAWDELTGEQILKAMSTKDDFKAELIAMAAKANEKHAEEDEEEEHHHHHHHDDENGVCSCGHHHHDDDDDEDEHEHHHDHDEDDDHDEHEHHHDHDEDHDHEEHCCCGHHHHDDDEDEDDDEELSPAVEKAMTVAGVVLAVIIVLIVLLLVSKALGLGKEKNDTSSSDSQQTEQTADEDTESEDGNSSSANTVVMPNLLGKTMTEAKIELKELGIDITLKGSESSSKYSAGQIMEQNIAEGTKVEVGSSVEVTIAGSGSSGTSGSSTSSTAADSTSSTTDTEATVPNVVGKDEATARAAIEAAGLTVGTVTESSSDTVTSGLVISQTVAANTKTAKGTKVNLVLSSGPSSVKVTDVIGHEQSRAEQELAAAGFQVSVKEAYSSDVRSGLVISTTPDRGTPAKPGSTVTMTVSQGKEKVTIPSVSVGMTYEAAAEKLEDAGFTGTISEATESSDSVGSGFVTRYSPSGTVDPDGTVTIYVSTGSASGTGTEGMPAN